MTVKLKEIYKMFPSQTDCIKHLETIKWNNTPVCPYCKSLQQTPLPKENRYHCNTCDTSYSVTVGTLFHRTRLDLQKWFLAIDLVIHSKKNYSARQLGRDIEVTKDTAVSVIKKIRKAFFDNPDLLERVIQLKK